MKKLLFLFPLTVMALACQQRAGDPVDEAEIVSQAVVTNEGLPDDLFCDGWINVKVTRAFAAEIEANTDEDGLVDVSRVRSMGFAVEELGIVKMNRLFPYAGKFEARTREEGLHLWYEIRYDENKSVTKAAGDLKLIDGIEIIEPKPVIVLEGSNEVAEYVTPSASPAPSANLLFDDPEFKNQWHYYNDGSAYSSQSGCDINVLPVWTSFTTGNPDVIVAVVDGGIDYNHEDLADNMWHDPKDSRHVGYNFCTDNYAITAHNHGTHVAGTVAAVNNNGKGVCGVAGGDVKRNQKGVKLMSCQIFSNDAKGGSGEKAIKWAADNGAVIAQNSWGYTSPCSTPTALKDAVDYFIKYAGFDENRKQVGPMAGGIVIFSAGNENSSMPYGADYEKLLTVTSVGADYRRAYYSNYGEWCDVAAPGGDVQKGNQVLSTLPGNQYGKMQGTSMACPHVSGVAALVVSKKASQGFTCDALREILVKNVTDISGYNRNTYMGSGLVNAYTAVVGSGGKAPEKVKEFSLSASSNTVTVSAVVPSDPDDGKPNSLMFYYSTSPITGTDGLMFANFYVGDLGVGDVLKGKVTGLGFSTNYYFAVVACDLGGNKSALSANKSITTGINHAPEIDPQGPVFVSFKAHEVERVKFSYSSPDGHYTSIRHFPASKAEVLDTTIMDKPVLVLTGADAPEGKYSSRIIVADVYGLADTLDVNYTILANHPPIIVNRMPNQVFGSKSGSAVLEEKQYFSDEDGEQLKYSITNTDESVVNVNYSKGYFYITAMGFGIAEVNVTASDVRGESVSQSFKVLVRDSNEPADIYPNPVVDGYLKVRTSEDASVSIKIISMQGSVVYDATQDVSPFVPATIDMKSLPAGTYTVKLEYGSNSISKTIVKL